MTKANYPWAIYVIRDGRGDIRYVGVSKHPEKRLGRHIREARAGGNAARLVWFRQAIAAGDTLSLDIVEWTSDWMEAEKRWIAQCRTDGCVLVNTSAGGLDFDPTLRRRSGSYPQIKYVRRQMAASIKWLRTNNGASVTIQRAEAAYKAMTRCIALNRKRGRLNDLEEVFRARFKLAPGLKHGAA